MNGKLVLLKNFPRATNPSALHQRNLRKEPQHSSAVRLELIKHLQFTAMKMFKCLKGEESVRCLWVLRAARKDDVSEEMHDYLIAQCSNVSLNRRHTDT